MTRSVLIVDDHASFRSSARRLLQADGYVVVGEAADGAAALAAVCALRPDVVLLDVQLPDVDGFDLSRRLADLANAPTVVLTSSRDWSELPSMVTASGARGFISKAELSGDALTALVT